MVPLDPPHTWYRYHHLFAELLHQRLRLSGISESELHQRASTWFESQGFMPEAVEHALRAKDWANATRLIGLLNEAMLKRGEAVTLMNWWIFTAGGRSCECGIVPCLWVGGIDDESL